MNFEKVLRFLTEHSKTNTFIPFGFYEILPVDLAQTYEYGISEKWDPGPRTLWWDPGLGLYGRTLR